MSRSRKKQQPQSTTSPQYWDLIDNLASPTAALIATGMSYYGMQFLLHELSESADKYRGDGFYSIWVKVLKEAGYTLSDLPQIAHLLPKPLVDMLLDPSKGLISIAGYYASCAHLTDQFMKNLKPYHPNFATLLPTLETYRAACNDSYGPYQGVLEIIPKTMEAKTFLSLSYAITIFLLPPLLKKLIENLNHLMGKTIINKFVKDDQSSVHRFFTADRKNTTDMTQGKTQTARIALYLLALLLTYNAVSEILTMKNELKAHQSVSLWTTIVTPFLVALLASTPQQHLNIKFGRNHVA